MAMPSAIDPTMDPVECTPASVRAALARLSDADTLDRYDRELDSAYRQARAEADLSVLIGTVRRWWFEIDAMRDQQRYQEYSQRIKRYQAEGPPPPDQRVSRSEVREQFGL